MTGAQCSRLRLARAPHVPHGNAFRDAPRHTAALRLQVDWGSTQTLVPTLRVVMPFVTLRVTQRFCDMIIVPTLCVGMQFVTLCITQRFCDIR